MHIIIVCYNRNNRMFINIILSFTLKLFIERQLHLYDIFEFYKYLNNIRITNAESLLTTERLRP